MFVSHRRKVFTGYTEGKLTFPPTYKVRPYLLENFLNATVMNLNDCCEFLFLKALEASFLFIGQFIHSFIDAV